MKVEITKVKIESDRRYRVLVLLQRVDRPKYWTFKCFQCGADVGEVVNAEVQAVSDLVDTESVGNMIVGHRCNGRLGVDAFGKVMHCGIWYYFKLN